MSLHELNDALTNHLRSQTECFINGMQVFYDSVEDIREISNNGKLTRSLIRKALERYVYKTCLL